MAETIFVGIDLGTSRTSITASNGFRKTIWSYVGYPKDHVALKRLGGREIIYGQEALENRMSVHLYRPLAGASVKQQGVVDPEPVKKAIRDWARQAKAVDKARPANVEEGGDAYTLIELR